MNRQWARSCLTLLLLLTTGCSPFSRALRAQVDEKLTLAEVLGTPDRFTGKKVLWGGVIVETVNTQAVTLMKVRQADLDLETRPKDLDTSQGRFLVRQSGFLDPAIYAKDREITVFGEIVGKEDMPLGESHYTYPVVNAEKVHLWEKRQVVPYIYYDPWFWDYGPYPWFYGPYPYPWRRW